MTLSAASEKDALLKLLASWSADAKARRDAHRNASNRLRRWHFLLGVPALLLSALVAMLVFATMQRAVPIEVTMAVGAVSVCAAVLTACQTFLRCSDRAEQHRQVSAEYEGIANRAELLCAMYQSAPTDDDRLNSLREACTAAQERMASLASRRPEVSERDQAPQRGGPVPAIDRPIERTAMAPVPAAAPSSVPPTGGLEAAPPVPPPARLPMVTLPPVRPPQPHGSVRPPPSMPAELSAASGSSTPAAVERRERRASYRPPPLPSTGDEGTSPRGPGEIGPPELSSSRVRGS